MINRFRMTSFLLSSLGVAAFIGAIQWLFWHIYRRKNAGLRFPHARDESFFHFFTHSRMRIVTIVHAIFMLLIFMIFSFLVW